ncbi:hypothetical protein PR048_030797 [Dryococelus australis]|uniref:KHDC4/BBP-like KH-domain type I domain-containing protein n=1 Tax=Dryococelus australis TaxID=614101 RepID=A0ABQ9G9X7_9NEOP|nr:hypothetical protein PR048_030797 [Dryococelus australis]
MTSTQFNFVGKLLGPKGNSLKRLQEDTMTKMAILGKGSMRDKHKAPRWLSGYHARLPTKAIRVQSPAGSLPDFRKWDSCRMMSLFDGFSSGISRFPPPLQFAAAPFSLHFIPIGSQDLAVESRPDLSTQTITLLSNVLREFLRVNAGMAP